MLKTRRVLMLLVCCLLVLVASGCSGGESTATVDMDLADSAHGSTTLESTTTTLPPATWESLNPGGDAPGVRFGASLTYVPSTSNLILFGGWTGGTSYVNGVFAYDPSTNTWIDLSPKGVTPAPRAVHSAVYDPDSDRVIVFGGYDGISYYNDTWAYDIASNTWIFLHPAGSVPAARGGHSLVYDPDAKTMILFGGWNGLTEYNDTWAYDPTANTWANLRPAGRAPAARDSQAVAYDPDSKSAILFGGWSTTKEFADTWAYDPVLNTWSELVPSGESPTARASHQMVYDPTVEKTVLFGGGRSTAVFNDTWSYDFASNSWTQVDLTGDAPAARTGYALAYCPAEREVLLFGGSNGIDFYDDLWALNR
jgi:N-acetylneuraminic acid mutarotase